MSRLYSVWRNTEEQWDPSDIDPPDMKTWASSAGEAAIKLAEDDDYGSPQKYIVRDDEKNTYRQIELVRDWVVEREVATTLEELSAP